MRFVSPFGLVFANPAVALAVASEGNLESSGVTLSKVSVLERSIDSRRTKSRPIIIVETKCYNENQQPITCPTSRTTLIVSAVIGGILGSILLAFVVHWAIAKYKQRRREKKFIVPRLSFGKQEYQPLQDPS